MKTVFQSLLLLARATDRELARQVQFLKVENEILRSKLPARGPTPKMARHARDEPVSLPGQSPRPEESTAMPWNPFRRRPPRPRRPAFRPALEVLEGRCLPAPLPLEALQNIVGGGEKADRPAGEGGSRRADGAPTPIRGGHRIETLGQACATNRAT